MLFMDADDLVREVPQSASVVENISAMNCRDPAWLSHAGNLLNQVFVLRQKLLARLAVGHVPMI